MDDFKLKVGDTLIGRPVEIGEAVFRCNQPVNILSVAPFKGQGMVVNDALNATIKLGLPTVGSAVSRKSIRIMWAGQGLWFIVGEFDLGWLADVLSKNAATTDQTDAWVTLTLGGADVDVVMSRLCSLDLSEFSEGQTARTDFAHMASCITPLKDGYEVMVMRSFAKTAVHHIKTVMTKLAAQRAL